MTPTLRDEHAFDIDLAAVKPVAAVVVDKIEQRTIVAPAIRRPDRGRRVTQRLAFWSLILCIATFALVAGLIVRRYAWDQTEPLRFQGDINNAFRRGTQALQQGYLNVYDQELADHGDGDFDVDYAPGRLALATLWTKYVRTKLDGPTTDWRTIGPWPLPFYSRARQEDRQYELVRPLLIVNTTGEIAAAIAVFLLVSMRTQSSEHTTQSEVPRNLASSSFCALRSAFCAPPRSIVLGLVAALFFWFNLALISNAHMWPQWDSWLLPFLLWALVAASSEWWFAAGVLIAVGAMFKAQILFGAPVFILWPLFRGKLAAIVRFVVGVATGTAACTAVWLVRPAGEFNTEAIAWVALMTVAFVLLVVALRWNWRAYVMLPLAAIAIGVALWPIPIMGRNWLLLVTALVAVTGAVVIWAPRRAVAVAGFGWVAGALLMCIVLFNGSTGWFKIGIAYGTHRYVDMTMGPINNLPSLLQDRYGWRDPMDPAFTLPAGRVADAIGTALSTMDAHVPFTRGQPLDVPLKYLLVAVFATATVLCSFGAAMHDKRGSPRFLAAVATPWLVMFAVLTQMHDRYLMWAAAMTSLTVALGPGFALLHLLVTVIAYGHEANQMMRRHASAGDLRPWIRDDVYNVIVGWNPGIAWAVLLCAAIYLYISVAPDRRRRLLRN